MMTTFIKSRILKPHRPKPGEQLNAFWSLVWQFRRRAARGKSHFGKCPCSFPLVVSFAACPLFRLLTVD
jgi:hypothetical protein